MSKKLIGGLAVAAALFMAAPASAHHGGHGNGYGRDYRHDVHRHHVHRHYVHERIVTREYRRPVPVYQQVVYPAYPAPASAPGIQIVLPDIFIPFR